MIWRLFRKPRPPVIHGPPVGLERAEKVVAYLDHRYGEGSDFAGLIDVHRDYCGHGLFRDAQGYFVARSTDGYPTTTLYQTSDRTEFVAWLAVRTDEEMSGEDGGLFGDPSAGPVGNQRLSRGRIDGLLAAAEK